MYTNVSKSVPPGSPVIGRLVLTAAGAVLLIAAVLFLAHAVPAQAHATSTILSGDGSAAAMAANHKVVAGCDHHKDGHRAYLRLYIKGKVQPPIYDPDGSGAGCATANVDPAKLSSYNICVQTEGCARPVHRKQF